MEEGLERMWGVDVSVESNMEGEMSRMPEDFEAVLADLGPTAASRAGALSSRPRHRGPMRPRRPEPELAGGLALMVARMQEICKRDPELPGAPSMRTMTHILSHCLDQTPGRSGASVAAELNGRIKGGGHPVGGARALEASVLRAAEAMDRRHGPEMAREQALPFLAALLPMLKGLLPTLIPMLAPMLGNLLGGLVGGKSVASSAAIPRGRSRGGIDIAYGLGPDGRYAEGMSLDAIIKVVMDLIPQLAPVFAKMISDAAPGVAGQIVRGLVPQSQPQPQPQPQVVVMPPSAPAKAPQPAAPQGAPLMAQGMDASALAGLLGGAGGAGGKIDPSMIAGLLKNIDPKQISGLLQGIAGNAGGINQLLGGPGHELVKSVVDRLPIEKMFDGKAWIPQINHDQFVSTLPWERVLSMSAAEGAVGQLFVPGRKMIKADRRIKLALAGQTMTDLGDGKKSWIFAADRVARIGIAVTAGPEPLSSPFVDVRLSCDGTPGTGLKRSVFRLAPLEAGSSARTAIEIEPEILMAAARHGGRLCLSVRLVQKKAGDGGPRFVGNELRLCAHVTPPLRILFAGKEAARDAERLEGLTGLIRRIPGEARGAASHLRYAVSVVATTPSGLARHSPLMAQPGPSGEHLSGGLEIAPSGLADLARRQAPDEIDVGAMSDIEAALSGDPALRMQLAAQMTERLPAGKSDLMVTPVFRAVPAFLVRFDDIDDNGNPARRDVRRIHLPVPAGIEIHD
jgi:hypothetical protein